ncbi:glycosyl transferase [Polymorphobacter glacialis]|uniref:Glycosyl transferase n=2 Tax=Sandarakinorhabdus glacialis TaxID=1614636 RepID=A0A916ZW82_9SPHN|nr:glycosyl transferase [Polymorphobacter glacialis]
MPDNQPRRVLVVASLAWSLVNFRGRLLADMVAAGHHVTAAAPDVDPEISRVLKGMGVDYVQVPMQRASQSVVADLGTLAALVRLIGAVRPDVILAYTQKPIVYSGIAARLTGHARFYAMVSGLGHAFTDDGAGSGRLLRRVLARLYRAALARAQAVIVFNSDDGAEMARHGMLPPGLPVVQVPGSGIDIGRFAQAPLPPGPPIFLLVARLLVNKGLREYVAAARVLRAEYPGLRFQVLGPPDANPAGLPAADLDAWRAEGVIEYLGETRDVVPYLAAATVFVLPTWYREGLPRTILEAMAIGRAVITTDAPGCRDAVSDGDNGYLVPVRDAAALAEAMRRFARDPELAARMGARGRDRAENRYDVALVNRQLMATMDLDRSTPIEAQQPRDRALA